MQPPLVAVDLDPQAEGVENRPAQLGIGAGQGLAEVGECGEDRRCVVGVDGRALPSRVFELSEGGLGGFALGLEVTDSVADEHRIDARLDRLKLTLDLAVDLAEPVGNALPLVAFSVLQLVLQLGALRPKVSEPLRAEDAAREKAVDHWDQVVLADVLPFAVADRLGGVVAVGGSVAAGVIGRLAVTAAPLHPQRVVPGGAVDDAAQQVGAFLRSAPMPDGAGAAAPHLGLDPLELLVLDQRRMPFVGLDPFGGIAAYDRADTLLMGARVEPVPVKAAGVGRVFEHRLDRGLRPFAGGVAAGVDVAGWGRAARAVQVVGDLLVAGAREEAIENLGDDWRVFGIGD